MKYPFVATSKNDPNGDNGGLGYNTKEEAEKHRDIMNSIIHKYNDIDSIWNKNFWKEKPLEWIVKHCGVEE